MKWDKPHAVDDATAIELAPTKDEIPAEFFDGHNAWVRRARRLFTFGAIDASVTRSEIDGADADRHLARCLCSLSLHHDHKIAAVAYLLSLWMSPPGDGECTGCLRAFPAVALDRDLGLCDECFADAAAPNRFRGPNDAF